jgi:hypothetical protein
MSTETSENAVHNARPEVVTSATLYLMSMFARNGGNPCLVRMIMRHLKLMVENDELEPMLRSTCNQLLAQWEDMLHRVPPRHSARHSQYMSEDEVRKLMH